MVGTAGTFTGRASGYPTPSLAESGALPPGLTFVDHHDGTATLSGTPAPGSAGAYPLTLAAVNGIGPDARQDFTLTESATPVTPHVLYLPFVPNQCPDCAP